MRSSWPAVLFLAGCNGTPSTDSVSPIDERHAVIDPSLWSAMAAEDDPFEDRPESVNCPSSSWAVEVSEAGESVLEVATGLCDYAGFTQASLVGVEAGDRVGLSWAHSTLTAEDPAEAHVAVWLGDVVLWDSRVTIPAEAAETRYEVTSEVDVPAGTQVSAHLHNHGDNTWTFGEIWMEAGEALP